MRKKCTVYQAKALQKVCEWYYAYWSNFKVRLWYKIFKVVEVKSCLSLYIFLEEATIYQKSSSSYFFIKCFNLMILVLNLLDNLAKLIRFCRWATLVLEGREKDLWSDSLFSWKGQSKENSSHFTACQKSKCLACPPFNDFLKIWTDNNPKVWLIE